MKDNIDNQIEATPLTNMDVFVFPNDLIHAYVKFNHSVPRMI